MMTTLYFLCDKNGEYSLEIVSHDRSLMNSLRSDHEITDYYSIDYSDPDSIYNDNTITELKEYLQKRKVSEGLNKIIQDICQDVGVKLDMKICDDDFIDFDPPRLKDPKFKSYARLIHTFKDFDDKLKKILDAIMKRGDHLNKEAYNWGFLVENADVMVIKDIKKYIGL